MFFTVGPYLITAVMRGTETVWIWTPRSFAPRFWAGGFDPRT